MINCYVYSANRRLDHPLHLHLCGLKGRGLEEMSKHDGFRNWDVYFHEDKPFHAALPKEKTVYLTAESGTELDKLEDDTYYVIGGLVDHNNHKVRKKNFYT